MSLATLALPAFCSSLVLDGHNMSGPSMVALANALQQHPGTFSALTLRDAHAGDAGWCTARALEGYAREYGVHYP